MYFLLMWAWQNECMCSGWSGYISPDSPVNPTRLFSLLLTLHLIIFSAFAEWTTLGIYCILAVWCSILELAALPAHRYFMRENDANSRTVGVRPSGVTTSQFLYRVPYQNIAVINEIRVLTMRPQSGCKQYVVHSCCLLSKKTIIFFKYWKIDSWYYGNTWFIEWIF